MSLAVKNGFPLSREGLVRRPRLLEKLADGRNAALVTIVAPAGYGKTCLLAEWAEKDPRPDIFLSLDSRYEDPLLLARDLLYALDGLGPPDARLWEALAELESDSGVAAILPLLAAMLEARADPLVLILDNADPLISLGALQLLDTVAEHLPSGSQLVLAARARPALPLGRLRAHGSLLELGVRDLAVTRVEAASLFRAAGVRVGPDVLDVLLRRTEGWMTGLYLAALCAREESDCEAALMRFAGDDHVVADYLRDEFLSGLDPEELEFLVEASILDQLAGPVCDAVLQTSGSGRLLRHLADCGLPLWPIDRSHEHYRPHQLLRDMLLGELRNSHPEREVQLHLRACSWYTEHGELDSAVTHAVAARAPRLAGDLLWEHLPRCLAAGRNELVQDWLERFSPAELSTHPTLALTAAHSALARGDLREAEHWGLVGAAALARSRTPATVASLPAGVAVIEAAVGRRGMAPMGRDAARADALEAQDSPWRAIFSLLQGVAEHLTGDPVQAREHLQDGIHLSCLAASPVETLCLSQLAMIAVEEGDWDQGADLIGRAIQQIERHDLSSYPTSALTFAISADVRSRVGHVDEGKRHARRAAHLLAGISDFIPWYEAETRIALARAALRLADIRTARALLAQASQLARRVPDAVVFGGWLDDTWGLLDSAAIGALAGPAALTIAELRILRFLPTHLSFREIGERLHVSTNTVKTQAHAVYRKLDVSSRSGAVARAAEIGLLDG
jgi:LuxR family maltose regulon positive regulatory protein